MSTAPPRKRPASVTTIAYLNIIFGTLSGLCFLCGGTCLLIAIPAMNNPEVLKQQPENEVVFRFLGVIHESAVEHIPFIVQVMVGQVIISMVFSIVLVVAGIGLLRLKSWARTACVAYGVVSIGLHLVYLIYTVAVVNPNKEQFETDMYNFVKENPIPQLKGLPPPTRFDPVGDTVSSALWMLPWMIYPVIVLIIMLRPNVQDAFRPPDQEPPPTGPGLGDDFFGFERPRGKEDF